MHQLADPQDFDAVTELPLALVYKHSTRCPISAMAFQEIVRLGDEHPDLPIHVVDVIAARGLSRYVADQTGVTHHSPQAILLVQGRVAWSVTHFDVRADELGDRLAQLVD